MSRQYQSMINRGLPMVYEQICVKLCKLWNDSQKIKLLHPFSTKRI